ncbi:MAG: hypothetical protein HFJ41_03970 [Clostridia bacterium]|nr:hypothetical protein [Clostridia bacterium]
MCKIMFELLSSLSISDWIEIFGIIVGFITSIVAIIISVKTLKQNSKMIEESTRPYITISKQVIAISTPKEYLVLKNYGPSGAEIIDINCNIPITTMISKDVFKRDPFGYLIGTFIAPGQAFCPVFSSKNIEEENIIFTIKYKSENKTYTTVSNIKTKQDHGILYTKNTSKGQELDTISRTLQEMIVRDF